MTRPLVTPAASGGATPAAKDEGNSNPSQLLFGYHGFHYGVRRSYGQSNLCLCDGRLRIRLAQLMATAFLCQCLYRKDGARWMPADSGYHLLIDDPSLYVIDFNS